MPLFTAKTPVGPPSFRATFKASVWLWKNGAFLPILFSLPGQFKASKAKLAESAAGVAASGKNTIGIQVEWKTARPDGTALSVVKQFPMSKDGRQIQEADYTPALDDKSLDRQRHVELVIYENGNWEKRFTLHKPPTTEQWHQRILDLEKQDAALTLKSALRNEKGLLKHYRQQKILDYEILNMEHGKVKPMLDALETAGNVIRKLNIKPSTILVSQNPDETQTKAVQEYISAYGQVMQQVVTPAGWGKADAQGSVWTRLKSSVFGLKMGFRNFKSMLSPARDAYRQATEAYTLETRQTIPVRWNPQPFSANTKPEERIIYRGTNLVKLAAFDAQWAQHRKESTKNPSSIRATRIL